MTTGFGLLIGFCVLIAYEKLRYLSLQSNSECWITNYFSEGILLYSLKGNADLYDKYNCSKWDEIYLSNWLSLSRIHPQSQSISQCIFLQRFQCNKPYSFINYKSFILWETGGIPWCESFYPLMDHINSSNINNLLHILIRIISKLLGTALSINEKGQGQFRISRLIQSLDPNK